MKTKSRFRKLNCLLD